ncbi:MAG TPA: pyridoxal-phosphate dependent enzyme [Stellaceae bacterium]|nr:pyridoxal-phosphate dependent enzyme [Stellaceae bacterium]
MSELGLETEIADARVRERAAAALRRRGVRLPLFSQLAEPARLPEARRAALAAVDPDAPDPKNLYRVHWYNDRPRKSLAACPAYLLLPRELTGVAAPIAVALGAFFPLIGAHKVLAAYGVLVPRLVTGRFDPGRHRAIWPSTGNYCRGGVAISRILGCRGVAVLPEGMSAERFDWLGGWVESQEDIIRTPGSESNVKEIYDKCAELERNPDNVILNQFSEFGNYLAHWAVTGPALARVFEDLKEALPELRLCAFVAASGSAGTLAAGDYLKEKHGAKIVAVEASECPTLLKNGFGEHNIQGIGDKHVPLIHNVMNTDLVAGVSDRSTDALDLLFNGEAGRSYLAGRRGIDPRLVEDLRFLGLSGIANVLAAIKTAKRLDLGPDELLVTVSTDSAALYASERRKFAAAQYPRGFDAVAAGEVFGEHLKGIADNDLDELDHIGRTRIFNLGYYTWVEQQGVALEDFERRRDQRFWRALRAALPRLDARIAEFNAMIGEGP